MSLAASSGDTSAGVEAGFLIAFLIIFYWVPTIIAVARRHQIPNVVSIVMINFFAGWTLAGWVVALAMAVRSRPQPTYLSYPPNTWQQGSNITQGQPPQYPPPTGQFPSGPGSAP